MGGAEGEKLMLVRHLFCGILVGLLSALASVLAGYSLWATAGLYVLGANVGLCASAVGALLGRRNGMSLGGTQVNGLSMQASHLHPAE